MPYPRYAPQYSSTPNASLSEGMFTPLSQLHVDARNLSDAGQYGYVGPESSGGGGYGPGWSPNGQTWSNEYQFTDHPMLDAAATAMQRAALYGRGASRGSSADALTDDPRDNAILGGVPDATNLALNLRRIVDAQAPGAEGMSRYQRFASQPHLANMLEPKRMALYQAAYGHSPDEEAKLRAANIEAMEKERSFRLRPQEELQKSHAAIARELGLNPEVLLNSIESLSPEQRKPGQMVNLPGHSVPDPLGQTEKDGTPKMIDVPGRPVFLTPRLLKIAYGLRAESDRFMPQGVNPQDFLDQNSAMDTRDAYRMDASSILQQQSQRDRDYAEQDALNAMRAKEQATRAAASRGFTESFQQSHPGRTRIR